MLEISHVKTKDSYETQEAYNRIYKNDGLLQRDSFYLWLIGLLKPVPGKILLDISCGQGRLVTLAKDKKLKSIGVDFAVEGVRVGLNSSSECGWLTGDGEKLPFPDRSIDYVTHIGSLEHYIHPDKGAKEIARILKHDGRACILLPNAFGMWGNIKHVWLHGEIFDDGQPLQRYATRNTWQKMLISSGMKIDRVIGYGEIDFPYTWRDFSFMLRHPQKIIRGVLSRMIPVNLSNHFVFICSRD